MYDKFYVRCGELEKVVMAHNPREACDKAVDLCKDEVLDPYKFYIDNRGMRGPIYRHNPKYGMMGGITQCCSTDEIPMWQIATDEVIGDWDSEEIEEGDEDVS